MPYLQKVNLGFKSEITSPGGKRLRLENADTQTGLPEAAPEWRRKKIMSEEKVFEGTIKFFNIKKKFGFIESLNKKRGDLFFRDTDLVDQNSWPQQNDQVEFEIAPGRPGKKKAVNVKKID